MNRSTHADKVYEAAESNAILKSRVVASWRRAIELHGLDPAFEGKAKIVDGRDLLDRRSKLQRLLSISGSSLDHLFNTVGTAGCCVLLTDNEGVVIERRFSTADESSFEGLGLCVGADWSERSEGTNGIGTCITEQRNVTIHADEHFHGRNTSLSCMDAPIFGADGSLIAALNVSSARTDKSQVTNRLIAKVVGSVAQQIEADLFHRHFSGCKIVAIPRSQNASPALLATDSYDLVVGATRAARKILKLGFDPRLAPVPLADVLGLKDHTDVFSDAEALAIITALARNNGNITQAAQQCGIGRATFYRRMNKLGIDKNRYQETVYQSIN